jgi:hypothetical protein
MKRFLEELQGLAWTLAGTGLVLITLSGQVRTYGLWISAGALVIHLFTAALKGGDE